MKLKNFIINIVKLFLYTLTIVLAISVGSDLYSEIFSHVPLFLRVLLCLIIMVFIWRFNFRKSSKEK